MRWSAVLAGLVAGTIAGCLLELGDRKSCGDGFHDPEWEDCDPSAPDSFPADACEPGEVASCNETCTLACCGNGRIELGEACDGDAFPTRPPCREWTCVACQVECEACGDGVVDADEECDGYLGEEIVGQPQPPQPTMCEDLPVPSGGKPYAGGGPVTCNDDCTWDRSPCHMCGDGDIDSSFGESCDGTSFRSDELLTACEASCAHLGDRIGCRAECNASCEIDVTSSDPACCILPGNSRSNMLPCCCEMRDAPAYCGSVFVPMDIGEEQAMGICPS